MAPPKGSEIWIWPSPSDEQFYHYVQMALNGNNRIIWTTLTLSKRYLALPKRHSAPSKAFR